MAIKSGFKLGCFGALFDEYPGRDSFESAGTME
jgi:hypothetical protein